MKKVIRIGWKGENFLVPLILMSKKERIELGLEVGSVVTVKKGEEFTKAEVQIQFRDLIGKGVTVNTLLAKVLDLKVGDEVEVTAITNRLPPYLTN